MSMVFQSYAIFPHLSVFENIAYGLKIRKLSQAEIRQRVAQVLDMVDLNAASNGRLRVEAWGQTFDVPGPERTVAGGEDVTLVVRPEGIRLTAGGAGVPGHVRRAAYLGSQVDYEVDVDGSPLAVVDTDPLRPAVFARDDAVRVQLLPA